MATNRLRKRLEDADDKTLSRMTENFCMIGTPLPSLDSKKDANEFKPVWEQEVRDDLGRRRFHGAFTGGFSAGYYNSVGSKEGWTPSTFRSSRKDKEKRSAEEKAMGSKPEDFMDEEDLVSFREGRGALSSSQTYAMDQQQSRQERDPLMDILGMQPERNSTVQVERQDLSTSIQIASTSLGTRLLQRMGWRPGQGLGPRVTFKRRGELLKMLGKAQENEEAEDEEAQKHLWPPPDTPMPSFSPKSDPKGLGWVGEVRGAGLNEALKRARAEEGTGASHKLKSRGGFGLGALEEDSDGEDNVYSTGTSIEQSTLARKPHDTWASREEHIILGRHPATKNALGNGATDSEREKTSSSLDNKWHDGRPVLEGFQIAVRPSEKDPWFEAPLIPPGWSPNPDEVWSRAATEAGRAKLVGQLSSADRASILGEARLPGPPPSILDYLSQKDKERLRRGTEAAASLSKKPSATTIDAPAPTEETWAKIPKLDSAVAQSALQGYVPFASEPEKQQRYREYLTSQAQPGEKKLRAAIGQTQAQFIAELHDFAKSASIFKPMSTIMASRFQSSSSVASDLPTINPGLHIPERRPVLSVEEQKAKAEAERKVEEEKKTQDEMQSLTSLQRNARLGLFGKDTTREIKVWKPNRLLCKRFNVPTPYPDDEDTKSTDDKAETENDMEAAFGVKKIRQMDVPKVNARWEESKRQLFQLAAQRSWEGDGVSSAERQDALHEDRELKVGGEKSKPTVGYADVDNIGLGEVARDQEEETFVKPPLDVFKAVFADDDSDDEDEVEIKPVRSAGDEFSDLGKQQSSTAVNGRRKTATSDKSRATPPPAPEEEGPNDQDPTRPLFVPRKRPAEESKKSFAGKELKKKKKKEKDKGKGKGKGLLTFSVDDEDEEGSEVDTPRTRTVKINRPRAADLF